MYVLASPIATVLDGLTDLPMPAVVCFCVALLARSLSSTLTRILAAVVALFARDPQRAGRALAVLRETGGRRSRAGSPADANSTADGE